MDAATTAVRTRHFLMCPPTFFDVVYAINPWMHPDVPADAGRALAQWAALREAYEAAGHVVDVVEPAPGLPDMVFAANAALVIDGVALLARFRHPQRRGEENAYTTWFRGHGFAVRKAAYMHEGEGDFACVGDVVLAAHGFRTDRRAHREVAEVFGRTVVSLRLVDPRFYHLDTALCVLSGEQIAYFPGAFDDDSRAELARRYPDALLVGERDACAFACNATSDGRRVFVPAGSDEFGNALEVRGFEVVPIDLSELRKSGGSVKCCTLELREGRNR
jgi:N-dimethylarginine dimethylaminohydrolase